MNIPNAETFVILLKSKLGYQLLEENGWNFEEILVP